MFDIATVLRFHSGMNLPTKFLLGAAFMFVSTVARAELTWEKIELEQSPAAGAESAVFPFKYENKGDKPIHISNVRTSCGCTTAALKKNDVAPGEKGEIVATLKIGDHSGLQQKTVTVETDDPKQAQMILTLKANVTQVLELQPALVFWQGNEDPKAKTIVAKAGKGVTIKSLDVVSSAPEFTTKVEPGSAAGEFKITVKPHDTAHQLNANLTIKPDAAAGTTKVFTATARVMPLVTTPTIAPSS